MSERWNKVTVYGPPSDIKKFRRLCLDPSDPTFRTRQFSWEGCDCTISVPPLPRGEISSDNSKRNSLYVGNFQQFTSTSDREYSFSFDTDHSFPEEIFELIAKQFPSLAFDCGCIESTDKMMGYGWFNKPPGGEDFRQDYDVPKRYWTNGSGYKRSSAAPIAHEARVAKLQTAGRQCSENGSAV